MVSEIAEMLFYDILQIQPSVMTGIFLKDLLNFLILPTIVLLIFLDFAASKFIGEEKKVYRKILIVAFYLIIVTQGFYGPFATFAANYMVIFLILAGALFFVGKIFGGQSASTIGRKIGDLRNKRIEREELRIREKILEDTINDIEREMNRINEFIRNSRGEERSRQERIFNELRRELSEKKKELERLQKIEKRSLRY